MAVYGNLVIKTKKTIFITEDKIKIAQMVADDVSRKEIASKTKRSVRTIEAHIDSMRLALGIQSTPALIAYLMRKKFIK